MTLEWAEKWVANDKGPPGGQGNTFIVSGAEGGPFFLKELRDYQNSERRERMRREVACYKGLSHLGIPKLIDSNTDFFDEPNAKPYLVTEFVQGQTLQQYIDKKGLRPAKEAVHITLKILDIVEYSHSKEAIHRDIKPDNIILKASNPDTPVLVDFGMSFYEFEDNDPSTPAQQEIGNRFLRLPEFNSGSDNKRDPRSDVTHCAGILFFLLTGNHPRLLRDANNRPPHQTEAGRAALEKHSDIEIFSLLNLFDRAFDVSVNARWTSAKELREYLSKIRIGNQPDLASMRPEDIIAQIREKMSGHEERQTLLISSQLKDLSEIVVQTRNDLSNELGNFSTISGGSTFKISEKKFIGMHGLIKKSDTSVGYKPNFVGQIQGSEIILYCDDDVIFRCESEKIQAHKHEIIEKVYSLLIRGVNAALNER